MLWQVEGYAHMFVAVEPCRGLRTALQHRAQAHLMPDQTAFAQAGAL